ncbi:hypothetical protein CVT26_015027 [Gymnopilus dilepis]|uniref:DUF6589 domain-containing protein n=1 Tax=Gymnopilus dilepis TaxID=231916 RepID=A0A409YNW7_9AGAR|nr:hypothetical protein CVT26_015027 [Gymnopilus dilepis]
MVKKRGGDFDDNFYRHTLSPNVEHFLRIKEEIENAFNLRKRGKAHTSPHLRDEFRVLLALYKEENLHSFCPGRSLGHAAINQFNDGYKKLDGGKLDDFLLKSTFYADVIADVQTHKRTEVEEQLVTSPDHSNDVTASEPDSSIPNSLPSSASESQSHEDDNNDEENPIIERLVSGSDYDVYLSDNRLIHEDWNDQDAGAGEEESSDEENMQETGNFTSDEESDDDYSDA